MFIAINEDREIIGIAEGRAILNGAIGRHFDRTYQNPASVVGPNEYGFLNVWVAGTGYPVESYTIEEHKVINP